MAELGALWSEEVVSGLDWSGLGQVGLGDGRPVPSCGPSAFLCVCEQLHLRPLRPRFPEEPRGLYSHSRKVSSAGSPEKPRECLLWVLCAALPQLLESSASQEPGITSVGACAPLPFLCVTLASSASQEVHVTCFSSSAR